MKPRIQLVIIVLVIIIILAGEAVFVPRISAAENVVIKTYPTSGSLVQALLNGEVDVAPIENLNPQTLAQLKNDANLDIIPISNFGFTYIGINLRNPPLNNTVFREAMLYGFNRERVLNQVLSGYGETLSPGLFSSAYAQLGWRNDSVNPYPYDPAKASQLLDSIGFNESSTGVRIDPSTGQQLRTIFIFSRLSDPQAVAAANLFAEDMQAIGLPVVSFSETDFDFYSGLNAGYYFDMYIDNQPAGFAPTWLYDLFAGVNDISPAPLSTNLVGYRNSAFDQCSKRMMTAPNLASARVAAMQCQEELSLDVPAIPVYSKSLLIVEQKGALRISPFTGSLPGTLAASLSNVTTGGTIRIGEVGGLVDIDPATSLSSTVALTLRLITEPLLEQGPGGMPEPGLVERWQMADNATNLTLDLQQGSQYFGGLPVTAQDVAATLNWLVTNAVPSTPLYPMLSKIGNITVVDDHRISISLRQSDYFAAYEMGDLFALPSSLLPNDGGPLALLLSGALRSSGSFALVRFVQGSEVDLQRLPTVTLGTGVTLNGVQGQNIFGFVAGGSQVQIISRPLYYEGQPLGNATYTVSVQNASSQVMIEGSHVGFGIYSATLNLNNQMISEGNDVVTTELYAQLPTGVLLQFDQQILVVHPPELAWQILVYLVAMLVVGLAVYNFALVSRRGRARRVRRATLTRRRRRRT